MENECLNCDDLADQLTAERAEHGRDVAAAEEATQDVQNKLDDSETRVRELEAGISDIIHSLRNL